MASHGTYEPEDDEDTIELELTAEEMLGLSQAAKEHFAATAELPVMASLATSPPAQGAQAARKKRVPLWPVVLVVALVGIAAAFAWRPRLPHREVQQLPPSPAARSMPAMVAPPAAPAMPAAPQAPPIRVKNPFDPKEVFEFPAGTSKADARQKVSELLLQRAIDRGGPRRYRRSAGNRPVNAN
ncbi:MAG TPA: hypothetical protein VHW25_05260 [Steroidobacteraceae bacterium]|nr:hypothetical protein [Steroidobacteraceae bacterium]